MQKASVQNELMPFAIAKLSDLSNFKPTNTVFFHQHPKNSPQIAYLVLYSKKGGLTMEDFLKAIANVGFPIAVAAYLLII